VASYVCELEWHELPFRARDDAIRLTADTIGVLLHASHADAVQRILRTFPLANGPCTAVGIGRGATLEQAAFVNGVGGHDIELDDTHASSRTHTACVIIPAALATGELTQASGRELLTAIVAAYDVECRMSKAMGVQDQITRGFHATGVCGAVGASVAAARLFGLDAAGVRAAMTIAAGQSSGLMVYDDDPTHGIKSLQAGTAARNGVTAAVLARNGFTGVPDVFGGERNVLRAFGGDPVAPELMLNGLGSRFEISGASIKKHACCGQTHSAIDALLVLMARHLLAADDLDEVDVQLAHGAVLAVDDHALWTHNVQYVLALAAVEGQVAPEHFSTRWTSDPAITALSRRVTMRGSDTLQAHFPEHKGAIVRVRSGTTWYTEERSAPRGNPADPFTRAELKEKFVSLATGAVADDAVQTLWEQLLAAESMEDCRALLNLVGAV
jgi:2-methylcitrate dehydratase PrpD